MKGILANPMLLTAQQQSTVSMGKSITAKNSQRGNKLTLSCPTSLNKN